MGKRESAYDITMATFGRSGLLLILSYWFALGLMVILVVFAVVAWIAFFTNFSLPRVELWIFVLISPFVGGFADAIYYVFLNITLCRKETIRK